MTIWTKWVAYNGEIGVTESGEFFEISTGTQLNREYHNGQIKYRKFGSEKRYSWRKLNKTKKLKSVEIIEMPF